MKASEAIEILNRLIREHGDLKFGHIMHINGEIYDIFKIVKNDNIENEKGYFVTIDC